MNHYQMACPVCERIVSQCRCPGPKVTVKAAAPCDECKSHDDPLKEWKYALIHAHARQHEFQPSICGGCEIVQKLLKESYDR